MAPTARDAKGVIRLDYEDCLREAPAGYLETLAARVGAPTGLTRQEMIAWLVERARSRSALGKLIDGLPDPAVTALKGIVYSAGGAGVTVEQCSARIRQLTGKGERGVSQLLGQLLDSGLVFVGRYNYRQVYYVPEDVRRTLLDVFFDRLIRRVQIDPTRVSGCREDGTAILGDLVRLLSFLRKHEVKVTQAGTIYRRTQREIIDTFLVQEEVAADPGETADYPERLGFMIGFARWRRLIAREQGLLRATDAAAQWVQQALWQMWSELYQYWRDGLASRTGEFDAILSLALSLPAGTWVSLRRLACEVGPMTAERYHGDLVLRLEKQFLTPLLFCGWLARGECEDGPAFCITEAGRAMIGGGGPTPDDSATRFLLQPNFELLVPRNVAPSLLWELEDVSELVQPDQMMIYRLTKQSVYRALTCGWTGEKIIDFLATHSRSGIPQNVRCDLQEWCALYGRVRFEEVCLLRCDSPALAELIRASRRTGPYILGEISPVALIVDKSRYTDLLRELIADGHLPRPGIVSCTAPDSEPAAPES